MRDLLARKKCKYYVVICLLFYLVVYTTLLPRVYCPGRSIKTTLAYSLQENENLEDIKREQARKELNIAKTEIAQLNQKLELLQD